MENACQSSRSISFPRVGWKGEYFTLLMQNEDSVFHRAFKPDLTSCSVWKCRSKRLWLLMVWQSVLQQWGHDAAGCGAGRVCSGGWHGSGHLSLMISVPSSLGRHHKMRGEHRPQLSLPLACGRCLQLWSLPQGYLLCPAAWEMNPSHQVQPPYPISSPAPEAVVMAIADKEEENWDKQKACSPLPSAGSRWSTTVSFLQPQEPLSPLILSRVLFPWVTCACGLVVASPWACWLQLHAAWTVRHLFVTALLHAYASAGQRGRGRGYYLKWDRKLERGRVPSLLHVILLSVLGLALHPFLLLHLCLKSISSFIPDWLAGLCPQHSGEDNAAAVFNVIKTPTHCCQMLLSDISWKWDWVVMWQAWLEGSCMCCSLQVVSNRRARGNTFKQQLGIEFHNAEKCFLHWDFVRAISV